MSSSMLVKDSRRSGAIEKFLVLVPVSVPFSPRIDRTLETSSSVTELWISKFVLLFLLKGSKYIFIDFDYFFLLRPLFKSDIPFYALYYTIYSCIFVYALCSRLGIARGWYLWSRWIASTQNKQLTHAVLDCRTTYQQNLYVQCANMRLICTTNKAYSPDLHVFELQCNWVGRRDRRCPMSLSLLRLLVALILPTPHFL